MPEGPPLLEEAIIPVQPLNGHDVEPIESYQAGEYSVIKLMNTDKLCRELFPEFVKRALGFIDRMNVDTDKIWLGNILYTAFANRSPHILMLVALDTDTKMIAHCIVYPEIQGTRGWIGHVLQLEKDKNVHEDEIFKVGHRVMEDWVKGLGMKEMKTQTDSRIRARYFERFGYKIDRYVLSKDLG